MNNPNNKNNKNNSNNKNNKKSQSPPKPNKLPQHRRCVSCRQIKHKNELLRVVRTHPEGKIEINRGMGRSAYICPQTDCISIAQKDKKLVKSLRSPIPQHIYQQLSSIISPSSD